MVKVYSTVENLQVLYEDNHLLIVNKRAGDIVQGDKTGDLPLSEVVKNYLAKKYDKPGAVFLGVVHRLDRPTTGIVVFARTTKALTRLNALFAAKNSENLTKTYWCIVAKTKISEKDELVHYLQRNTKQNKSYAYDNDMESRKKAILQYQVRKQLDRYTLLEINLETGRHHQIRAQLAAIGAHIKGDLKYGADRSNKDGSIHLHARKISLMHPVKKEVLTIIAPLPDNPIWNACSTE